MTPQITEDQLKSLKLFAYYCRSHGAETVHREYYIEYCGIDWEEQNFESPQIRTSIESYAKIDEVLNEIIETNELVENSTTDCDLRGRLTIEIDCIERILTADAMEWQFSTNEDSFSKDLTEIAEEFGEDTYNEVLRLFEQIGEDGEGMIQFQGGGDDGSIEDVIYINGSSERVPKLIQDMVYEWLTDTGLDWFNNEGGQGSFTFIPKDNQIILEVGTNYEEDINVPLNFKIKF
jgi:hypothetical protein